MATAYTSTAIQNAKQPRLVSIGVTPVYQEITPTTLALNDTFDMFYVPDGVRIFAGFLKAVGGTGLDTGGGSASLTLKVDLIDDNGTTNLLATTSSVRTAGQTVALDTNRGVLVVSAKNNAKLRVTAVAATNTLGTSKIGLFAEWSSFQDNT
jgi:hypothetical protein